jgi:predicted esterase
MLVLATVVAASTVAGQEDENDLAELVTGYLWSENLEVQQRSTRRIQRDAALSDVSRERFQAFEQVLAHGRPEFPPRNRADADGEPQVEAVRVSLPDGRTMPVLVYLPEAYDASRSWPMLLAMHGGPLPEPSRALDAAARMISVWREAAKEAGWLIVSPVMAHVVARAPRTEERLPYEILTVGQMESVLSAVQARFRVDPERIVSTGISLGSNFSIAYAASRPDRFAAIVPVSTEGDSRERLLRNLQHVPVYVLQGARDRNIRDIRGPRALAAILDRLSYDIVYREFGDRAHEGFQELYPDVMRWLASRTRRAFPKTVLRVPHGGIVPTARRVHWLRGDTRQAMFHGTIREQRIDIEARWVRTIDVFFHDELVDMDRPVTVWINGERVYEGEVERSVSFALEEARERPGYGRPYAATLELDVPSSDASLELARAFSGRFEPRQREGQLSFWEMYAVRTLEDRFPTLGFQGEPVQNTSGLGLTGEQTAIRIEEIDGEGPFARVGLRVGDVLVEVGGEPFYAGRGLHELRAWLFRELTGAPRRYELIVIRDGERIALEAELSLGEI